MVRSFPPELKSNNASLPLKRLYFAFILLDNANFFVAPGESLRLQRRGAGATCLMATWYEGGRAAAM